MRKNYKNILLFFQEYPPFFQLHLVFIAYSCAGFKIRVKPVHFTSSSKWYALIFVS